MESLQAGYIADTLRRIADTLDVIANVLTSHEVITILSDMSQKVIDEVKSND